MNSKKMLAATLLLLGTTALHAQKSPEEKFNMAMYAVTQMYVDSINKAQFVDQEIARILQSLDPFSQYLPPATAAANEEAILGTDTTSATLAPVGFSTIKSHYMADGKTGYICLSMFAENTLNEFRTTVAELQKKGMKNLILDLRNNGGGLFDVAVALADEFLDGDKSIVTTQGAHVPSQDFRTQTKGCMERGRLVLLVGEHTMSAAEIFTAAIRDWDRGVLVGADTYGKGLIQETLPFSDGSALRITVARYLTPAGMSIQKPYNGQVFTDSTRTWRSLTYQRPLVCKGGVAADVKVAADDSYMSDWYTLITYAGVQTAVGQKYVSDLKDKLLAKYPTPAKFISSFETPGELLTALCQTATQAGIPTDEAALAKAGNHLRAQLKAVVCSQLYGDNNLYYQLFNERNAEVKRAMEIIGGKEYDSILKGK